MFTHNDSKTKLKRGDRITIFHSSVGDGIVASRGGYNLYWNKDQLLKEIPGITRKQFTEISVMIAQACGLSAIAVTEGIITEFQ